MSAGELGTSSSRRLLNINSTRSLPFLQPHGEQAPLPFSPHKEPSTKGQGRVRIENRNHKKTSLGS